MTFGTRLREARRVARMSQSELTRLSGVPKTMLSRYENDHILPSISTLQKLAAALGVGEGILLGDGKVSDAFAVTLSARGIVLAHEETIRVANVIADMVEQHDERVAFITQSIT